MAKNLSIPLDKLHVSELNTRQPQPDDPKVRELAASLKVQGQLSNLLVRPHPKKKGHYEIATGARRRVAAQLAGFKALDANVKEMDDEEFQMVILVDNLQRENPDPREEAALLCRLKEEGMTPPEIAAHIGKSESWVARRMRLTHVVPAILALWKVKKPMEHFSVEMMEFIGSLPEETQRDFAKLNGWVYERFRSRRALEEHFQKELCRLDKAPFKLDDPRFFVEGCGPGCAKDSSAEKSLFDFADPKGKKESCGRCLNPACFSKRLALYQNERYRELCGDDGLLPVYGESTREIQIGDTKVRPEYAFDLSAKEAPGAQKVVFIDAAGKFHIRWLPKSEARSGSKQKKLRSPEAKRKEGIQLLQGKRWLAVREKLLGAIEKASVENFKMSVEDFVAIFGLPFKIEAWASGPIDKGFWQAVAERGEGLPMWSAKRLQHDMKTTLPREQALWPAVQKMLLGLIPGPRTVADAGRFEQTYVEIGRLIQFDTAEAKRIADTEILPPKSWGKVDPHTLKPVTSATAETPEVEKPAKKKARKK